MLSISFGRSESSILSFALAFVSLLSLVTSLLSIVNTYFVYPQEPLEIPNPLFSRRIEYTCCRVFDLSTVSSPDTQTL